MSIKERQIEYKEKYKKEFPFKLFHYCKEPLENIQNWYKMLNDTSGTRWHLHHRAEIVGDKVVSKAELKRVGDYYNITADKLIFLTKSEHHSLHNTGDKHPMFGKTGADHPTSKRIEIDGIPYCSIEAAINAFGKNRNKIYRWLKTGIAKYL